MPKTENRICILLFSFLFLCSPSFAGPFERGLAAQKAGDFEKALDEYGKADGRKNAGPLNFNMGSCFEQLSSSRVAAKGAQLAAAKLHYTFALKADSNNYRYRMAIARISYKQEKYRQAKKEFEYAMASGSNLTEKSRAAYSMGLAAEHFDENSAAIIYSVISEQNPSYASDPKIIWANQWLQKQESQLIDQKKQSISEENEAYQERLKKRLEKPKNQEPNE